MKVKTSLPYLLLYLITSFPSNLCLIYWIWHEWSHSSASLFHLKNIYSLFVLNTPCSRFPPMSLIERLGLSNGSFSMYCENQVLNGDGRTAISLNICPINYKFIYYFILQVQKRADQHNCLVLRNWIKIFPCWISIYLSSASCFY